MAANGSLATAVGLVMMAVGGLAGCQRRAEVDATQPAQAAPRVEAEPRPKVRIAMTAAFVSEAGMSVYQEIAGYLAEKLGMEVELVTGFSYSAVDQMLDAGAVDIGFVCGVPYVLKRAMDPPPVELVAAPVMKASQYGNQPKYFSYVIVRKDAPFQKFLDLRGRTFVYNERTSNSGYNMPRARLIELGVTGSFFGAVLRSGSHEESIRMVATGAADASAVDSLVLDYDLARNGEHARQVRIVDRIGPVGIPPVVASTKTAPELVRRIQDGLLGMNGDPEGRRILDLGLIDRFEAVDDSNYDDIRQAMQKAERAGWLEIR